MANILTPVDVYQIMNEVVSQATGQKTQSVVDTSSFVSVGETALRTGTENVLKAISQVVVRTIFSARPYTAKFGSVRVDGNRWGGATRKINYLYKEMEQSQNHNTQLAPDQLANGQSIDMYKINAPEVVQTNFYGTKVLQKHITRFRDQLAPAFHNEGEFAAFFAGMITEWNNEIELANEEKSRLTILNAMAGVYEMAGDNVIDLAGLYNANYGTTYTRQELLSTHLDSFMKFFAAQIKIFSKRLTDMSTMYHANLTGYKAILRHTPKGMQKMLMYDPLFITAESTVYPTLFNTQYLNIGAFEGVNFWQSQDNPTAINITPNILDPATGESKTGTAQTIPYVIGLLYDEEALGIYPQFDYTSVTPFNSAGEYYNIFAHWRFNAYNDFTENMLLFIIGDGGAPSVADVKLAKSLTKK